MGKIRILIAHSDNNITNKIINSIKSLEYAEIVGMASNGRETYDKIIDLKPEVVFAKFDMETMNGLEIVKKSKENLGNDVPVFNMITNTSVSDKDIREVYDMIGKKLNSFVSEPVDNSIIDNIMETYREYKENK